MKDHAPGSRAPPVLFDVDNLPYGVFSAGGASPAWASGSATTSSTSRRSRRRDARRSPVPQPSCALGRDLGRGPDLADRAAHARPERGRPSLRPLDESRCSCRSRSPTTSTSTARWTTPATSAGSSVPTTSRSAELAAPAGRLPRPRRHRRRLRHRSSRPCGQRKAPGADGPDVRARARASTSRPSSASWSARRSQLGEPVAVDALRRPRLRRHAAQRLVRPRHPGLGVRPARPFLGKSFATSVSRLGHAAGGARRGPGRPARRRTPSRSHYLAGRRPGARPRHRRRGGAQRRDGQPAAVPRRCTGRPPRCSPT